MDHDGVGLADRAHSGGRRLGMALHLSARSRPRICSAAMRPDPVGGLIVGS
jgi:hypothetical protein